MSGENWQLGPLSVAPQQALRGVFQVDVGVTTLDFPIALINGTEPDPVVLVTAGMDGDAYAGIEAAQRLIDALDPAALAGRVMICPILDPLSFEAQDHQNPLDGLFLCNVFPGNLEGKPTQRLAYFIYQNFVMHADVWLDLHAVEASEEAVPFVWTAQHDDAEINAQNHVLIRQAGETLGLMQPPRPWGPVQAATVATTALLVSQAGCRYHTDETAIQAHLEVVHSVLAGMHMLNAPDPVPAPTVYLEHEPVLAEHTGLWYPHVQAGEHVTAGQVLGEVFKLDGSEPMQTVKSAVDGVALAVQTGLAARPHLRLAHIAHHPDEE